MTGRNMPSRGALAACAFAGAGVSDPSALSLEQPHHFIGGRQAMRQTIRDRHGHVLGTIEQQSLTGRSLARNAHGVIVAVYDERSNTTRDAHGVLVGRGNLLAAFLVPR